jgi:Domain of unknown function (DUF4136)
MTKLLGCALAVLFAFNQLPPKEGKIATITDPKANFAAFTTYTWEKGYEAHDVSAHKVIVAAIDAEMAARGFRKLESGTGNVTIRYHTNVRTDVDLDKIDQYEREGKLAPTKTLGRLVIVMRDANDKRVWAADTVQPIDASDATARNNQIRQYVTRLFETYPGGKK